MNIYLYICLGKTVYGRTLINNLKIVSMHTFICDFCERLFSEEYLYIFASVQKIYLCKVFFSLIEFI